MHENSYSVIEWKMRHMIEDSNTSPTIEVDGKKVPKSRSEWDERDFSCANLNSKAISCIINRLSCNEFHKVMIQNSKIMQTDRITQSDDRRGGRINREQGG